MTRRLASAATAKVVARMSGSSGLNYQLAALNQQGTAFSPPPALTGIRSQNAVAELTERGGLQYPNASIYCERITNTMREKFRSFSGTTRMTVELRHSHDHLDGLQGALEAYADAVARTLEQARGDWGDGIFYAGGYEVSFGPVKQGGKAYVQSAKVTFELGVSRN